MNGECSPTSHLSGLQGSPTGDVVLGTSPQGSFEHAMLRFMQVWTFPLLPLCYEQNAVVCCVSPNVLSPS